MNKDNGADFFGQDVFFGKWRDGEIYCILELSDLFSARHSKFLSNEYLAWQESPAPIIDFSEFPRGFQQYWELMQPSYVPCVNFWFREDVGIWGEKTSRIFAYYNEKTKKSVIELGQLAFARDTANAGLADDMKKFVSKVEQLLGQHKREIKFTRKQNKKDETNTLVTNTKDAEQPDVCPPKIEGLTASALLEIIKACGFKACGFKECGFKECGFESSEGLEINRDSAPEVQYAILGFLPLAYFQLGNRKQQEPLSYLGKVARRAINANTKDIEADIQICVKMFCCLFGQNAEVYLDFIKKEKETTIIQTNTPCTPARYQIQLPQIGGAARKQAQVFEQVRNRSSEAIEPFVGKPADCCKDRPNVSLAAKRLCFFTVALPQSLALDQWKGFQNLRANCAHVCTTEKKRQLLFAPSEIYKLDGDAVINAFGFNTDTKFHDIPHFIADFLTCFNMLRNDKTRFRIGTKDLLMGKLIDLFQERKKSEGSKLDEDKTVADYYKFQKDFDRNQVEAQVNKIAKYPVAIITRPNFFTSDFFRLLFSSVLLDIEMQDFEDSVKKIRSRTINSVDALTSLLLFACISVTQSEKYKLENYEIFGGPKFGVFQAPLFSPQEVQEYLVTLSSADIACPMAQTTLREEGDDAYRLIFRASGQIHVDPAQQQQQQRPKIPPPFWTVNTCEFYSKAKFPAQDGTVSPSASAFEQAVIAAVSAAAVGNDVAPKLAAISEIMCEHDIYWRQPGDCAVFQAKLKDARSIVKRLPMAKDKQIQLLDYFEFLSEFALNDPSEKVKLKSADTPAIVPLLVLFRGILSRKCCEDKSYLAGKYILKAKDPKFQELGSLEDGGVIILHSQNTHHFTVSAKQDKVRLLFQDRVTEIDSVALNQYSHSHSHPHSNSKEQFALKALQRFSVPPHSDKPSSNNFLLPVFLGNHGYACVLLRAESEHCCMLDLDSPFVLICLYVFAVQTQLLEEFACIFLAAVDASALMPQRIQESCRLLFGSKCAQMKSQNFFIKHLIERGIMLVPPHAAPAPKINPGPAALDDAEKHVMGIISGSAKNKTINQFALQFNENPNIQDTISLAVELQEKNNQAAGVFIFVTNSQNAKLAKQRISQLLQLGQLQKKMTSLLFSDENANTTPAPAVVLNNVTIVIVCDYRQLITKLAAGKLQPIQTGKRKVTVIFEHYDEMLDLGLSERIINVERAIEPAGKQEKTNEIKKFIQEVIAGNAKNYAALREFALQQRDLISMPLVDAAAKVYNTYSGYEAQIVVMYAVCFEARPYIYANLQELVAAGPQFAADFVDFCGISLAGEVAAALVRNMADWYIGIFVFEDIPVFAERFLGGVMFEMQEYASFAQKNANQFDILNFVDDLGCTTVAASLTPANFSEIYKAHKKSCPISDMDFGSFDCGEFMRVNVHFKQIPNKFQNSEKDILEQKKGSQFYYKRGAVMLKDFAQAIRPDNVFSEGGQPPTPLLVAGIAAELDEILKTGEIIIYEVKVERKKKETIHYMYWFNDKAENCKQMLEQYFFKNCKIQIKPAANQSADQKGVFGLAQSYRLFQALKDAQIRETSSDKYKNLLSQSLTDKMSPSIETSRAVFVGERKPKQIEAPGIGTLVDFSGKIVEYSGTSLMYVGGQQQKLAKIEISQDFDSHENRANKTFAELQNTANNLRQQMQVLKTQASADVAIRKKIKEFQGRLQNLKKNIEIVESGNEPGKEAEAEVPDVGSLLELVAKIEEESKQMEAVRENIPGPDAAVGLSAEAREKIAAAQAELQEQLEMLGAQMSAVQKRKTLEELQKLIKETTTHVNENLQKIEELSKVAKTSIAETDNKLREIREKHEQMLQRIAQTESDTSKPTQQAEKLIATSRELQTQINQLDQKVYRSLFSIKILPILPECTAMLEQLQGFLKVVEELASSNHALAEQSKSALQQPMEKEFQNITEIKEKLAQLAQQSILNKTTLDMLLLNFKNSKNQLNSQQTQIQAISNKIKETQSILKQLFSQPKPDTTAKPDTPTTVKPDTPTKPTPTKPDTPTTTELQPPPQQQNAILSAVNQIRPPEPVVVTAATPNNQTQQGKWGKLGKWKIAFCCAMAAVVFVVVLKISRGNYI